MHLSPTLRRRSSMSGAEALLEFAFSSDVLDSLDGAASDEDGGGGEEVAQ